MYNVLSSSILNNCVFNNAISFDNLGTLRIKLHWVCELVNQGLIRTLQCIMHVCCNLQKSK